ncbi:MAG: ATP-binding protein [Promethearchaeia archaeon]
MTFKIQQIGVNRYGPLEDTKLDIDPEFQCIFGPNESGKTLLIDAILKMTLSSDLQKLYGKELQRVIDDVHGWVLLDVDGEEQEITNYADAEEILPLNLANLRDLLVIRNSDLQMLDQAECLDRATDLMMGLRTREIADIKSALKDRGQLTDTRMDISSSGGKGSAGEQLKLAKNLSKEIEEYHNEVKQSEIPKLESRIIELSSDLKELKAVEVELEKARKLVKFKEMKNAYIRGKSSLEKLEGLPEEAINEGKQALTRFQRTRHNYDRLSEKIHGINRLLMASIVGTIILGLSAIILDLSLLGLVQSVAALIMFFVLFLYRLRISRQLNVIEESRGTLLQVAALLGSDAETGNEAVEFVTEKIEQWKNNQRILTKSIGVLEVQLGVSSASNERVLEQAQSHIKKREESIDTSVDRDYDEGKYDTIKEDIKETEEQLKKLQEENKKHVQKLGDFENRLRSIRFEGYLGRPVAYYPNSIDSLLRVNEDLEEFISAIENEAKMCRSAIEIMDSLAAEEKEKVSDLLSESSRASKIFSEITGGRYSEIIYNPGEEEIRAVRKDGTEMPVLNLSRGAKDQLYLSIRLALAESILKGDSGFFILDDPFLASDLERRGIQIETLQKMVEQGWQVLYFSANRNLAEKFKLRFNREYITLPPLE